MGAVPDEFVPFRPSRPMPDAPKPADSPGLFDTVKAAGTVANWPYRSLRYLENRDGADFDLGHEPLEMIRGTKYESDPGRFAYSRDEQETRAIMQEWDADEAAAGTLARAGWTGTVAAVGMGMADPTIFLPVAKVFSGVAQGYRATRLAADVALASGGGAAIGEAAMAVTTPHYGAADVATGIGSATILGGLLGGAVGALTSTERATLTKALDTERAEWGAEIDSGYAVGPQSAGAAAADTRQLELRSVPILDRLPDPTSKASPTRRVLNSPFLTARRAVADLAETPYIFKENLEGVATTQGPALNRLVMLETNKARYALAQQYEQAYTRYRFGGAPETWRQSISQKATRLMDHTGRTREKASSAEFRNMVDDALRNGDAHPVPEVAETAKFVRANVLAPWRDRAIKAGLLPEGVEASTADSYMMRVWNKQKLVAERPRVVQVFSDWLEVEEGKKSALQDTMRDLTAQMEANTAKAEKLQASRHRQLGKNEQANAQAIAVLENQNAALRQQIEDAILKWDGKSSKSARSALDRRAADGPRLDGEQRTGADADVDAAVKRILSTARTTDRREVESLANQIIERIVGNPDGRLPYDSYTAPRTAAPTGNQNARGPLASRSFMIPDNLVREFLDTDSLNTAEIYLQTMAPDVLLTERFGDVDMTDAFIKLEDEAVALQMAAKTPQEREKLKSQYDSAVADLAAMRDRIRHTYGYSSAPGARMLGRVAATAARYDLMTNLGGATLSSMADLAGIQWRYGLSSTFRNAWRPFLKTLTNPETRTALAANKRQLRSLGIGVETWLQTRASGIADVTDMYRPSSRFERGVKLGADKFGLANLLAQWTDFAQMAAGMVSSAEIIDATRAVVAGKANKLQVRSLAESGIDAAMAQRIVKQIETAGGADTIDDIIIPNSGSWGDAGARDAFEGALARDVDIAVIRPGAEKPLFMSKPVGALLMQYKSFIAASTERILVRSMQARDINVLHGMVSAIGLGILSESLYSFIVGRDMPSNPGDLIKAGMSRSGMLGWYQEANALSEKWFDVDAFRAVGAKRPDSRYISREKLSAMLGPTAGKLEALIRTGANAADLNWTAADTRRMRRMMVGQNLFYIRGLLDKLEGGLNESVGIEPLKGNK